MIMSLPKMMHKNYNLPKVTALIHASLLTVLLASIASNAYVFLVPDILFSSEANHQLLVTYNYFMSNKGLLVIVFGLLFGLNSFVNYLLFRLKKKPIAYSMSFLVLSLQAALIGGGIATL
jgi:hypothetical protein